MDVAGWRIYYADRDFDSEKHEWVDLPATGVLGVVVFHEPPYRTIVTGGDWYWLEDGMPTASEQSDEPGTWIDPPDKPNLKRGEQVNHREWEDTRREMMGDREWP